MKRDDFKLIAPHNASEMIRNNKKIQKKLEKNAFFDVELDNSSSIAVQNVSTKSDEPKTKNTPKYICSVFCTTQCLCSYQSIRPQPCTSTLNMRTNWDRLGSSNWKKRSKNEKTKKPHLANTNQRLPNKYRPDLNKLLLSRIGCVWVSLCFCCDSISTYENRSIQFTLGSIWMFCAKYDFLLRFFLSS